MFIVCVCLFVVQVTMPMLWTFVVSNRCTKENLDFIIELWTHKGPTNEQFTWHCFLLWDVQDICVLHQLMWKSSLLNSNHLKCSKLCWTNNKWTIITREDWTSEGNCICTPDTILQINDVTHRRSLYYDYPHCRVFRRSSYGSKFKGQCNRGCHIRGHVSNTSFRGRWPMCYRNTRSFWNSQLGGTSLRSGFSKWTHP